VLSHVSVRARNEKVLFATVFDAAVFASLKARARALCSSLTRVLGAMPMQRMR
jgi:hypothetical protein